MKSLLVFDYDGVLVDSYDVFMPAFIDACEHAGYPTLVSKEDFVRLFDDNLYRSLRAQGLSRATILRIVLEVKKAILANRDQLKIFPGVTEAVHSLATTHYMAVATSNETSVVRQLLIDRNLDCFENIIGSDQEPSKAKSLCHLKQKFEGMPVYFIGDTMGDIKEGHQAEVTTIGVTWGWHGAQVAKAKPDYLVTRPIELVALFNHGSLP
jgi:phosphoglycolate phosphatase